MFTRKQRVIFLSLIVVAAAFRIAIVDYLPNDSPGDSITYAQLARNVLEHHVYSHSDNSSIAPSYVRVPGYPLFLAAVYSVFGHTNNTAVRIVQALLDTGTCVLVAVLAFLWQPNEGKKTATAMIALAFGAINPFTTIYAATILAEVPATFLGVAVIVTATLAFRAQQFERELRWWTMCGLLAGVGVMFRPDSGLFALAAGLLLLIRLGWKTERRNQDAESDGKVTVQPESKFRRALILIIVYGFAVAITLAPWTIRNLRVFHSFQPLAPFHANMPDEFVPLGYERWLKTWIDKADLVDDVWWELGVQQIDIEELPDSAFDSQAEHDRVEALFDEYNGPEDQKEQTNELSSANKPPQTAGSAASEDEEEEEKELQPNTDQPKKAGHMTPEIDAAFGEIANERIARHPFRYYILLPAKRAHALWFNTHSDYYPFADNLLPLNDPDKTSAEKFWLPIFAVLVGMYTLLGIGGVIVLSMTEHPEGRVWVVLITFIFVTRLALFSTVVSVEPRYVVEFFPILAATSGIAIMSFKDFFRRNKPSES